MLFSSPAVSKLLPIYESFYRPDASFSVHDNTLYYKTKFIFSSYEGSQSPKKQFILSKTWSLMKNKLCLNLQLKTDPIKAFFNDIPNKVLKMYWKKTQLRFTFSMKFLVKAWSFTKNKLLYRLPHCHLW